MHHEATRRSVAGKLNPATVCPCLLLMIAKFIKVKKKRRHASLFHSQQQPQCVDVFLIQNTHTPRRRRVRVWVHVPSILGTSLS